MATQRAIIMRVSKDEDISDPLLSVVSFYYRLIEPTYIVREWYYRLNDHEKHEHGPFNKFAEAMEHAEKLVESEYVYGWHDDGVNACPRYRIGLLPKWIIDVGSGLKYDKRSK